MIVYGRNPVREAVRGPRSVHRIWATPGTLREPWWRSPAEVAGRAPTISEATPQEIEARCGSAAHQGVCAEVEAFRYAGADEILASPSPLIVVLDQIQDPQNLGSICRSAECAGADALVIPERRTAEVTPAVCKASAGAVEYLPIARVRNVTDFLGEAKATGAWCYGADADGKVAYDQVDWRGTTVLVLGAEGKGLRPRVASACDALVSLPMLGRIESLNVSAAAAVLLYAAARGRRADPGEAR